MLLSDLWLLSEAQMRRIEPYFPLSHGIPRVDDRRIVSGIIFGIIAGTFFDLAGSLANRASNLPMIATMFVVALAAAWKLKGAWVVPMLVAAGAATGFVLLG